MNKFKLWISVFRLRTLPLSLSGIIIAGSIAYYNGYFDVIIFSLAILVTLGLQILSNLANDYGDGVKGTDNRNRIGPERGIQSGKISPKEMFDAIKINIIVLIFLIFMLIFSAFGTHHFLSSIVFFILGFMAIYAALRYTIGETAYGYRGLGDLMVFLFFGIISVLGAYYLFAKSLEHVLIMPACIVGLLSTAVLNLNNMRDLKSDTESDKITVAVKLGLIKAKNYHAFLLIFALILGMLFSLLYYRSLMNLLFLVTFIPIVRHIVFVYKVKEVKELDSQLKILALSTFVLSLTLGLSFIYNGM
ncbi:MAG: 1,4-dihydroxy-2-naphthoate octaprenyltransferase [Flavobacteriaceae bacterium]|jgi:1,4-dihydroxy-2-naphthoate polyprenyltransferase|nr:1,4-dihydroxy-2-naphthoate octaprenyltransferase [Bacteroidota bacterium]MDG1378376.1 1,4-dihydroxy-2-naphthoate octaprenyltransferase [Flavobacteriaceae bacterium]MDG2349363.1 1,4-dihydroxy-2-naphthoate octaprenyltransferase [Flavobacteriaceae bacterium]|tara:strand:- start:407 stop:1318 length:912 start_codon:yes stop_codon:yes gene_type:complete